MTIAGKFADTFKDFPPIQKPNSFTIDDAIGEDARRLTGRRRATVSPRRAAFEVLRGVRGQVPLASWNDGAAKSAILDFVARVTKEGGPDFVPPAERIATFDNDGTLWCEQPMQVQLFFLHATG